MDLTLQTSLLCSYLKCVVTEGEYLGQEVDCSNAVNERFGLTSLAVGDEAPKELSVEFRADGMPSITAVLGLKRRSCQIALYERIRA